MDETQLSGKAVAAVTRLGGNPRGATVIPSPPRAMLAYDHYNDFGGHVTYDSDEDGAEPETEALYSLLDLVRCPFCSHLLIDASHEWYSSESDSFAQYELISCRYCRFWVAHERSYLDFPMQGIEERIFVARARKFEDALPPGFETELAQHLRRDPRRWQDVPPERLEFLAGSILKASYPSAEVVHIGRSGDGGMDLLLVAGDGISVAQVKGRSRERAEPVETVRSLHGVLYRGGEVEGLVVSTAPRFSPAAHNLVGLKGGSVRLIDRGKLSLMLSPLLPDRPWERLVSWYRDDLDVGPRKDWVISRLGGRISRFELTEGSSGAHERLHALPAEPKPRKKREHLNGLRRPLTDGAVRSLLRMKKIRTV